MCLELIGGYSAKSNRTEAWKVVKRVGDNFFAPYRENKIPLGLYESDRTSTDINIAECDNGYIHKGIHVFTKFERAKNLAFSKNCWANHGPYKVIRCEVDPKDHVADGCGSEAVYTKVKIKECV